MSLCLHDPFCVPRRSYKGRRCERTTYITWKDLFVSDLSETNKSNPNEVFSMMML